MVVQESLEACHHVRFGHVDVVALRNAGRTVTHKAGQREFVHAALGTTSAECVTPAVELEGLQSRIADCFLVGVLDGGQMPRLAGTGEDVLSTLSPIAVWQPASLACAALAASSA